MAEPKRTVTTVDLRPDLHEKWLQYESHCERRGDGKPNKSECIRAALNAWLEERMPKEE